MEHAKTNGQPFIHTAAQAMGLPEEQLEAFVAQYVDMQVLYRSAIREVSNRLEILDDEFQFRQKRNPIHHIQTRLKSPQSMMEKLGRRNLRPSVDVLRSEVTDIAGVRVVCSYVDDIYQLAELLCAQEGVELVRALDYIKRPKPGGYRSLHIVVTVPVHFSDGQHRVPVEIQIRTIAMDFWASLEHELRYKTEAKITRDIVRELRDCADNIAELDERMQKIYHRLEAIEGNAPHRADFWEKAKNGFGKGDADA
ncbi:GTP pyrophosphokinase family protein [Ruminococcaceae bacterium OttesenSCG-928-O06]|nr:GTP pyrophosphokinase family protein [Ruminococcaceae bacterium OttesenSCG-928-O06]